MTEEVCFYLKADEAPALPGAYAMAIKLTDKAAVRLSGRSRITLPAGRYLYCGSAAASLKISSSYFLLQGSKPSRSFGGGSPSSAEEHSPG
jgi:hypothetical protein